MFKPDGRSRNERGLGKAHEQARREWEARVEAGGVLCCRCGQVIIPGKVVQRWRDSFRMVSNWHLDHNRARTGYLGAAHARCNVKAGAREGARRVNAAPKRRAAPRKRQSRVYGPLSS